MGGVSRANADLAVAEEDGKGEPYAGELLDGAKAIRRYLVHLGLTGMTERRVFHWAADGRLPVTKIGNRLVANKRTLLRHFGLE